jgi:hypothetical protein
MQIEKVDRVMRFSILDNEPPILHSLG